MNGFIVDVFPTTTTTYCITIVDDCETPAVLECVTVFVHPLPSVTFSQDTTEGCAPVNISFANLTPTNLVGDVLWDFGDGNTSTDLNPANTYVTPGCYDVSLTVTSPGGCVSNTLVTSAVCANPHPVAEFDWSPHLTTIFDPEIDFTNQSQGNVLNQWYFDDLGSSTDINPTFVFPGDVPGSYDVQLIVTNEFMCTNSITHTIVIEDETLFFAPNAFTPNSDGINDFWYAEGGNIDPNGFELFIFNRWGNIVFKTTDMTDQWDGKYLGVPVPIDTYVWKVKGRTASRGDNFEHIGHVSVVR
jgi:gliding motility-associated-like protein